MRAWNTFCFFGSHDERQDEWSVILTGPWEQDITLAVSEAEWYMALTQLINSKFNNQWGPSAVVPKINCSSLDFLIDHWRLLKMVALERRWTGGNESAPLAKCSSYTVSYHGQWRGGGVWQVHNKLTHCFSEHGGKQMLVCRAKSAQTPYQFWDLIDPAGRQSPLAFGSRVNELIRHCMVSVLGTCQEEHTFGESCCVQAGPAHRGEVKRAWAGLYGATAVTWQHMRSSVRQSLVHWSTNILCFLIVSISILLDSVFL